MAVFLDKNGFEPSLEQVPGSPVPPVEGLGIDAVELPHADGEIAIRSLDEKMVMVIHEAVGRADPVIAFVDMGKGLEECLPIGIVLEDRFLFIAA